MDSCDVIGYLQSMYPENLNDEYKCYWWQTSGGGLPTTYFLKLNKRLPDKDGNLCTCLRACSDNPQDLINALKKHINNR